MLHPSGNGCLLSRVAARHLSLSSAAAPVN